MNTPTLQPALDAAPKRHERNPSRWSHRVVASLLASTACLVAIYLGLYQLRVVDRVWDPVFGAQSMKVLDSGVSKTLQHWIGVPDAFAGAVAYLAEVVLALAGGKERWKQQRWLVILYGLNAVTLALVGAVLVILQGTVIGAWCAPCLLTALLSWTILFITLDEVWPCIRRG